MGAIAGALVGSVGASPDVVGRMLVSVPHRGDRIRVQTIGRCSVGIVSREDTDDTTIAVRNGLAVAACGVIDNLVELSAQLGCRGESTAEVILAAFQKSGDDAWNRFRGVFSAVITDGMSIRAFRDHMGFGVLYFREEGDAAYVATEVKMILAGSGLAHEPEPEFLEGLLYDRYEDQTLCAFKGVRRLPQGSVLSARPGAFGWSRFWHPERLLETARASGEAIQDRFDHLMAQAVGRALTGHDAVALSGGIDSPAVAAYAAPEHLRRYGRPLAAISAVYPQFPNVDERAAIEEVAERLGLDLHLFRPTVRPLDGLRDWVRRSDGPAPSSFAQPREMYLFARGLGYRTVLNGNYAEYLIDAGQPYLVTHLVRGRRGRALAALMRSQRARGASRRAILRQLARPFVPSMLLDTYDRRRREDSRGPDWLDTARFTRQTSKEVPGDGRWRQAQLASFFRPRLTVEADEIEQASLGMRTRWPWADVDLWEFFLGLRAETKYPDVQPRKLFVRRLLRGKIPDAILDRRDKTVFDDAAMSWLDYGILRELLTAPQEPIAGVDYERLGEHLRREDLRARDFRYVRNLAAIHAFLEEWRIPRN